MKIYLDKPDRQTSQIVMVFSYNKKSYKYYPSLSVKVKDWDNRKSKAKGELGWEVNEKIRDIEKEIRKIIGKLEDEKQHSPSQKSMVMIIKNHFAPKESKTDDLNYFHNFIENHRQKKKGFISDGLFRLFNTVKEDVHEVNPLLKFSEIDGNFFNEFIQHLADNGNLHNTIHNKVKKIKQMCTEALKFGVEVNHNYDDIRFGAQKPHVVYLFWHEVEALEKLTPNRYLDAFLFRCYTGVRFSDMKNMNPKVILMDKDRRMIPLNLTKQRKIHKIFLPEKAYQIWERNGFKFSDEFLQVENREIKESAKVAELNRTIQMIQYSLQKTNVTIKPLHEVISTHMARRTFARAWYDRGGNLNLLRDYLGHASLNTTLQYIGIESQEANDEASRIFG